MYLFLYIFTDLFLLLFSFPPIPFFFYFYLPWSGISLPTDCTASSASCCALWNKQNILSLPKKSQTPCCPDPTYPSNINHLEYHPSTAPTTPPVTHSSWTISASCALPLGSFSLPLSLRCLALLFSKESHTPMPLYSFRYVSHFITIQFFFFFLFLKWGGCCMHFLDVLGGWMKSAVVKFFICFFFFSSQYGDVCVV